MSDRPMLAPLWSGETPDKITRPTDADLEIVARYYEAAHDSQRYVLDKIGEGTIAFCSLGTLGLITVNEQREVIYTQPIAPNVPKDHGHQPGELCQGCAGLMEIPHDRIVLKSFAWVGIHLTAKIAEVGARWSSRNPRPVARIELHNTLTCVTLGGVGTFWWHVEGK